MPRASRVKSSAAIRVRWPLPAPTSTMRAARSAIGAMAPRSAASCSPLRAETACRASAESARGAAASAGRRVAAPMAAASSIRLGRGAGSSGRRATWPSASQRSTSASKREEGAGPAAGHAPARGLGLVDAPVEDVAHRRQRGERAGEGGGRIEPAPWEDQVPHDRHVLHARRVAVAGERRRGRRGA